VSRSGGRFKFTAQIQGTGLVLLLLTGGCASALKDPPTIDQLVPVATGTDEDPRPADEILIEAELEMSRLPDAAAVDQALRLYLEAAGTCEAPLRSYLGAARATAWLIEHESDPAKRQELATEGVQIGQLCRQMHPDSAECRYRLALAVGQQARERPSTALDGLDVMVTLLEELINDAPKLDLSGPHRVLALVLLRAPGWPNGPGDPELALEHAQTAVSMAPEHPPNHLVLGEALADNGDQEAARLALERSLELAMVSQAHGEQEAAEWIDQGQAALDDLR
jgi:tetratricopeptide (TPR) repeat protein